MIKRRAIPLMLLVPAVLLAGCNQVVTTGAAAGVNYIFDRPEVNLAEKSYAATDYLMQQGANFINKRDQVKVMPLRNYAAPDLSTRIGRVISKHVGERLQQLGYQVDVVHVSQNIENDFPYVDIQPTDNPDFVMSGTYYNDHHELDVKLRLMNAHTGELVGQFDYSMPMNWEIQRMSRPKPKIIRTTGQQPQPVNR
ncbi:MAG: FlgO family outer membrane protein [Alphaproteobacteria bacterium]